MQRIAVITATGMLALAADASASQITLQYTGFVSTPAPTGQITNLGNSQGVAAGQFNFNVVSDPGGVYWDSTLQAFCVDIDNNLVTNGSAIYDFGIATASTRLSNQQLALVGQLYDNHAAALGTNLNDAAFQLAIWEIIYEPDPMSLSTGVFSSASFGGARTIANGWLAGLDTSASALSTSWEFFILEPVTPQVNQALIVAREVTQVSEPGMLLLLAGGLGLLAGLRRRRD
ncbi:MAG: PEP-CTERM sorting domain-containing protein [Chromatiales bacterium]|nr:PEP-CTERM sorting domain-containing protein [Chromatiales bacterium]